MSEMTATVSETRAHFSKIAESVNRTHRPVTVFKNSRPWVVIAPVEDAPDASIPLIDWSKVDVLDFDPCYGHAILPQEAYAAEDEGLYDDLV